MLNTRRAEVDEPAAGDRRPSYHYDGDGGIALSSPLRRLAFAARYRDLDLLLTETVTDRSRILLHRDVRDRLQTVAPFLRWDAKPHTAVIDGRVQFLFDGYTTSDSYPYSAPVTVGGEELNYIRVGRARGGRRLHRAGAHLRRRRRRPDPPRVAGGVSRSVPAVVADTARAARAPALSGAAVRRPGRGVHDLPRRRRDRALERLGRLVARTPARRARRGGRRHPLPQPEARVDSEERGGQKVTPRRWRMQPAYGMARLPGDAAERFMLTTPFTPRGRREPRRVPRRVGRRRRPSAAHGAEPAARPAHDRPDPGDAPDPVERRGRAAARAAQPRVARPRQGGREPHDPRRPARRAARRHARLRPAALPHDGRGGRPAAPARDRVRERPGRVRARPSRARCAV